MQPGKWQSDHQLLNIWSRLIGDARALCGLISRMTGSGGPNRALCWCGAVHKESWNQDNNSEQGKILLADHV